MFSASCTSVYLCPDINPSLGRKSFSSLLLSYLPLLTPTQSHPENETENVSQLELGILGVMGEAAVSFKWHWAIPVVVGRSRSPNSPVGFTQHKRTQCTSSPLRQPPHSPHEPPSCSELSRPHTAAPGVLLRSVVQSHSVPCRQFRSGLFCFCLNPP